MYLHVIEGDVDLIAGLIHQHGVTVRESCPTNVLTTDTNIVTLKSNFSIQSLKGDGQVHFCDQNKPNQTAIFLSPI